MERKMIIHANITCSNDEIIGAKEAIADALELMGCEVVYINIVGGEEKCLSPKRNLKN